MKLKLIFGFVFLTSVFISCDEDGLVNPFKKYYTISGVYFEGSNQKPIPFADLILFSENLSSGSGKPKEIEMVTTDVNGYFEFKYPQKDKWSNLYIQKSPSGNPTNFLAKTLLKNITPNQNLTTNIYHDPFGNIRFDLVYDDIYSSGDTLYIAGLQLEKDSPLYRENLEGKNTPGLVIPFPLISNQVGPFEIYYHPDLEIQLKYPIYFGVGKSQLTEALNGDTTLRQMVLVRPFPNLSVVRLKLN